MVSVREEEVNEAADFFHCATNDRGADGIAGHTNFKLHHNRYAPLIDARVSRGWLHGASSFLLTCSAKPSRVCVLTIKINGCPGHRRVIEMSVANVLDVHGRSAAQVHQQMVAVQREEAEDALLLATIQRSLRGLLMMATGH